MAVFGGFGENPSPSNRLSDEQRAEETRQRTERYAGETNYWWDNSETDWDAIEGAMGGYLDVGSAQDQHWNDLWEQELAYQADKRADAQSAYEKALSKIGGFDASPYLNNIEGVNNSTASFLQALAPTVDARRNSIEGLVNPADQAALREMLAGAQSADLGTPADLRDAFDLGTNTIGVMRQSGDAKFIEQMADAVNEAAMKQLAAEQETELALADDMADITGLVDRYRREAAELQRASYEAQQRQALDEARRRHAASAAAARARAEAKLAEANDFMSKTDYFAQLAREQQYDRNQAVYQDQLSRAANASQTAKAVQGLNDTQIAKELLEGSFDAQTVWDLTGKTLPATREDALLLAPIIRRNATQFNLGNSGLEDFTGS